jgi:hypothetical protein
MYRELIKSEWFHTLTDDRSASEFAHEINCGNHICINERETPSTVIRGIIFTGAVSLGRRTSGFLYGIANLKENPTERIEGCFYDDCDIVDLGQLLSTNDRWFSIAIECLRDIDMQTPEGERTWKGTGWWTDRKARNIANKFDVETDRKTYYVRRGTRFEFTFPGEKIWRNAEHVLQFARAQYCTAEMSKFWAKNIGDCNVFCQ